MPCPDLNSIIMMRWDLTGGAHKQIFTKPQRAETFWRKVDQHSFSLVSQIWSKAVTEAIKWWGVVSFSTHRFYLFLPFVFSKGCIATWYDVLLQHWMDIVCFFFFFFLDVLISKTLEDVLPFFTRLHGWHTPTGTVPYCLRLQHLSSSAMKSWGGSGVYETVCMCGLTGSSQNLVAMATKTRILACITLASLFLLYVFSRFSCSMSHLPRL